MGGRFLPVPACRDCRSSRLHCHRNRVVSTRRSGRTCANAGSLILLASGANHGDSLARTIGNAGRCPRPRHASGQKIHPRDAGLSDDRRTDDVHGKDWWSRGESNPRPSHCERDALPSELRPQQGRNSSLHVHVAPVGRANSSAVSRSTGIARDRCRCNRLSSGRIFCGSRVVSCRRRLRDSAPETALGSETREQAP